MYLQRFKSVFALFWLFLIFKCDQVTSTTPSIMMDDDGYCGFSDLEEDLCSSYCYKSVKQPLTYIMELKEQMKAKAEEHLERDNEMGELRQRLLELSDFREQFKALSQLSEKLGKNEIISGFNQPRNNVEKTEEDIKLKAKDLNECIANRDTLKKEIEVERNNRIKMEERYKLDLENLENEKNRIINELKSDYKTKEEILKNQIKDINSQVSSYKQLEETQTDKTISVKGNSLKMKAFESLVECKERLPKTSCKGFSTGIYKIKVAGLDPFSAPCNGDIDGGGWIVNQNRFSGSEEFYRNWTEYRNGFGKLKGEFFIGLEPLHRITNSQRYELYIQVEYLNGTFQFARYNNFRIGNEKEKYKLQSVGNFSGTARNLLHWHLVGKLDTFEQDNEQFGNNYLAAYVDPGWWYYHYYVYHFHIGVNLNGKYEDSTNGTLKKSLKSGQMLIRPVDN